MKSRKLFLVLLGMVLMFGLSVFTPALAQCPDADGDGYTDSACGGTDCDDTDPAVNPGAAEVCDGKDTNCDGSRSWNDYDIDGDGYALCNGECNDQDAAVNPGATEICGDFIDNNCNNQTDEAGCTCPDADGDGHPAAFCGGDDCDDTDPAVFQNCAGCTDGDGDGFSIEGGSCGPVDCDDTDPSVNPGAAEVCDGKDTNCDGTRSWNDYDIDEDGYAVCSGDCNDQNGAVNPDATELCGDLIDNNCNNLTDEAGCLCPDADGDGHPAAYCGGDDCDDTDPTVFQNCPGCTDADGDGFAVEGGNCGPVDCDDTDPNVNPGEPVDVCDGKDTNCDGQIPWNDYDFDGDGYALCNGECDDRPDGADGIPGTADDGANINPGMLERTIRDAICSDGLDNDCDSRVDAADDGCFEPSCDSGPTTKDFPHFFVLLNPDDTVHPDNNSLICGKCHGAGLTDPIRGECQRCHADSSDPSDPLNGTTKDQYPLAPPYGYGTAPNVKMHSSETVGNKYGNWTMGAMGCSVCHNPHSQEQNNVFGTDYGMFMKEYICYDNDDTGQRVEEFVELTSATGIGSFADGPPYIENVCNMCHTRTNHHQRDGDAPGGQDHNNETDCEQCHPHGDGFAPTGGTPAFPHDSQPFLDNCDYCHVSATDFSSPIPDTKCDQCHTPTGSLKTQNPQDFGDAPDVITHQGRGCVGCHQLMTDPGNLKLVKTDLTAVGGSGNIDFTSRTGAGSFADGPPYTENVCNTCHMNTNHHQNDGTAPGGQDHNNETDCAQCHPHGDGFAPTGALAAPPHDTITNCDYCHLADFSAKIPDSKCEQCHTPGGILKIQFPADPPAGYGTAPDVLTHSDANGSGNYVYTNGCVDCHEPMFGTPNIAHVRTDLSAAGGGTNIVFTQRTGVDSFADGPPYDENVCNTCHTMTNHHRNDSSQPFPNQDHNNNADCALCHPHGDAFLPTGGDCLACHNQSPPNGSTDPDRRQIVEGTAGDGMGDFVKASHHVTDGTSAEIVTAEDCEVCHDQSIHTTFGDGQSVLLIDQDGGASSIYDGTGASVEGFCVSCHDADGSLLNGSQPFIASGDINSPPDMGWSAGVVSHSTFDACFNCHAQGHGSDFEKILAEDNEPGLCFNCHDADGPAATDLEGEFAKQFGHPVTAASSSIQCLDCHNPHQAEPGTHTPDGQWYPSSPDANTNLVSGVLSGVMGVEPSPWAPAWTKTDSYTVLDSAEKEYQVCFKCHARYSHQYSQDCFMCHPATWDPDLGIIVIGYKFRSAQREFNINNKSAHPVAVTSNNQSGSYAPKALSTSQLEAPWTNAGNQTMYCSDCHGANDELITGIRGPHGSSEEFMLKGPNTMWPAGSVRLFSLNDISSDNGAPESRNTNWRNELFCLNCHDSFPSSDKDTWKNEAHVEHDDRDYSPTGGDGDSNVYCIACHAVVPHGSHVSRLITYRSELPEYNTYNGVNYNVIEGFRKTSRFTYDKDDCRTVSNLGCDKHDDRVNNWD